jgi:hypothetical protein
MKLMYRCDKQGSFGVSVNKYRLTLGITREYNIRSTSVKHL